MAIPTTGISMSDIQKEMGGSRPISLSEYHSIAGAPAKGQPISFGDFAGKQFDVVDIITSTRTWTPRKNNASFIHIFVVGAGGSGGHGFPDGSGWTEGVAGAAGGGGGGVAYSRIAASSARSSDIIIGSGGAGVVRGGDGATSGNPGGNTRFEGSGLDMIGRGGEGGPASARSDGQTTTTSGPGASGGTASGGNMGNYRGGDSGSFYVSARGSASAATGGGAPRFSGNDPTSSDNASTNQTTAGMKVSNYQSWPIILSSYIRSRGQTAVLSGSNEDFDASNGSRGGDVPPKPKYGAGSGGSGHESANGSRDGGDGVVIIIYEI
jgi:hypothetical protein